MGLMDRMMQFMVGRMDKNEKEAMMDRMMDRMLAGFSTEDKQKLIETMMPKMMEGVNLLEMMTTMMPECLKVMLPFLPEEKRGEFVAKMVAVLQSESGA